jgi:predicted RNA binding protein YcfA (HicA-like mRNA interferase family)
VSPAAPLPRGLSGAAVVAVLVRRFGFEHVATKGSHAKVRHHEGHVAIVPLHPVVAVGTLRSVLRQAGVEPSDFVAEL